MSMSESQPMASEEELALSMKKRAVELWGAERASEIDLTIDGMAERIYLISQNLPQAEDEPAFYFGV